jgi:hypothetical protein
MIPAIYFYDVVLAVHIAAVVIAFGVTFSYPVFGALAARAEAPQRAFLHRAQVTIGQRVINPGLALIVIAGIYLASDRHYWSEVWVTVPLVISIVIGGLGGAYMLPRERRLAELADQGCPPEYEVVLKQTGGVGALLGILVLVAIFFMAAKPFA